MFSQCWAKVSFSPRLRGSRGDLRLPKARVYGGSRIRPTDLRTASSGQHTVQSGPRANCLPGFREPYKRDTAYLARANSRNRGFSVSRSLTLPALSARRYLTIFPDPTNTKNTFTLFFYHFFFNFLFLLFNFNFSYKYNTLYNDISLISSHYCTTRKTFLSI